MVVGAASSISPYALTGYYRQVEGRTHRSGEPANAYYMFVKNTVEDKILRTMLQRMADMKGMSGDDAADIQDIELLIEEEAFAEPIPA